MNNTYAVKSGDTLYGLYGPNWKQASGYTGDPTKLAIGTRLPAPANFNQPNYTPIPNNMMNQGSSLPSIANQSAFNALKTSMPDIASSSANMISPQSLQAVPNTKIPNTMTPFQPTPSSTSSATTQPNWFAQQAENVGKSITPPAYAAEKSNTNPNPDIVKPNKNIPDWVWNQLVDAAKQSSHKYGIPASLTLAQFMQETGGNPQNFIGGTNVFGIKGSGPAGTIALPTTEYINGVPVKVTANFAKYNTIAEAVDEHAKLLAQNPAYGKLQGLLTKGNRNPFDYAQSLQGIYATDPNYAKSLQNLIASYGFAHADDYDNYPQQTEMTPVMQQARSQLDQNYPQQ